MENERIQRAIERIKENIEFRSEDRKAQHRRHLETMCLQQAVATEYAARMGWKYVNHKPAEYIIGDIIAPEDILRKSAMIPGGKYFNLKALAEGKRWAYSRYGDYEVDCHYQDHPYYFRKDGRAVGIVAHLYGIPEDVETWASSKGLQIAIPDFPSWWFPGSTSIIQFAAKGGK